jgi:hypothetical protein
MAKETLHLLSTAASHLLRVRDALTKSEAMVGYSTRMIQESNFMLAEINVSATDQSTPSGSL